MISKFNLQSLPRLFFILCTASIVHRIYGEDFTTKVTIETTTLSDLTSLQDNSYVWIIILITIAIILTFVCILICFRKGKSRNSKTNIECATVQDQIKKSNVIEKDDGLHTTSIPRSGSTSPSSARTPKLTLISKNNQNAKLASQLEDIKSATLKSWKSLDVGDVGYERRKSAFFDIDPDVQASSESKTTQPQDKTDLTHLIRKMFKEPPQILENPPSKRKPTLRMEREETNNVSSKSGYHQTLDRQVLSAPDVDVRERSYKSQRNIKKSFGYFPDRTKLKKSSA